MGQYYEKIEVNGKEENLPKEVGYYFVKFKQKNDDHIYADTFASHRFEEGDKRDAVWLDCIDWYLSPVSQDEQTKDVIDAIHDIKLEEYDKIVEKQAELIEFYGQIIRNNAMFLHIHHIDASKEEIETGERLRSELNQIKERKK